MLNYEIDPAIRIAERIEDVRSSYKDDGSLEPVMIECIPLEHSRMTVVLLGGVGPDLSAPQCYAPWANSDMLGGIYQHPRYPRWYIRPDAALKLESSKLVSRIREDFVGLVEPNDLKGIIRIIIQLYYY